MTDGRSHLCFHSSYHPTYALYRSLYFEEWREANPNEENENKCKNKWNRLSRESKKVFHFNIFLRVSPYLIFRAISTRSTTIARLKSCALASFVTEYYDIHLMSLFLGSKLVLGRRFCLSWEGEGWAEGGSIGGIYRSKDVRYGLNHPRFE